MGFLSHFKSKKLILAAVAIMVIAVGFFTLKFMTSSEELKQEKSQTASRITKKTSTPMAEKKTAPPPEKKESTSPLYQAMKEMKDPFRLQDPATAELQDKISTTKKEIEYLKASLEEKKLRQEIKDIEMSLNPSSHPALVGQVNPGDSTGKSEPEPGVKGTITVTGILFTDEEKSALLTSGDRKNWVHEGEYFEGWEIKQIYTDRVMLSKAGRECILFCDRFGVTPKGEL